ncbi:MAG: DUF1194 domain-containing protein [Boseongicola sp.]|nr:DUF1194 domain-containing protein [Boseongicola sp.]
MSKASEDSAGSGTVARSAFFICAAAIALTPSLASAACRLALVLALDVSGSVDNAEYTQQLNGVAEALSDPEVQSVLFATPEVPVNLAIFEWSSSSYQQVILDWTPLNGPPDVAAIRDTLLSWPRARAPEATGLGAALEFANAMMARAPACWDQTLDISADGKNNDWPLPYRLRESGRLGDMNVNALVIATDFTGTIDRTPDSVGELTSYFQARIIHGPGAFVEVAQGYAAYAAAMKRKLLRELATRPIGMAPRTQHPKQTITAEYTPSR